MIKVAMDVNGTTMTYDISTMETLAKFQAQLTEDFFKHYSQEIPDEVKSKIFNEILEECESNFDVRCDLVEKITNDMPRTCEDIESRLVYDTDFNSVEELADAYENRQSALDDIYNIAREWC